MLEAEALALQQSLQFLIVGDDTIVNDGELPVGIGTIAKLAKYLYDQHPDIEFTVLAKAVIKELEGAFGLLLSSRAFNSL
jgi:methylthioribose-1-phosphate isomerase